ncbi:(2Fe-2S)-binding protein [Brevibacillus panacihumi W25]|uniref:(2Fe-2S)-binding protein n=1 Tax=Brevibacillus panacihumi W25 TaxID=1408254 RepID=V6M828_9BACL|nr:(2Fe-2S)-binding protein [Brevibacillus panacihumi]EST51508.1 (2Fe-2S)-binding protein [Brevibacillus panacihumi W25]
MKTMEITVTVNGKKRTETVETRMLLSDFIREQLRLTGTHLGCEHGVCGACTVLVNGKAARSCLMLAVQADGFAIDTVESLVREDGSLHPLQQAFSDNHALQCGFCTPGFMMTLVDFLQENPKPSEGEIREAISGNLCRCTGYANIVKAVEQASQALAKQGG